MSTPVLSQVSVIVGDIFQIPASKIGPGTSPDTIAAWDSIQHLNLVLALEQEFGIQFTPEEIEQMPSVELIADLVSEKLQACGVV